MAKYFFAIKKGQLCNNYYRRVIAVGLGLICDIGDYQPLKLIKSYTEIKSNKTIDTIFSPKTRTKLPVSVANVRTVSLELS